MRNQHWSGGGEGVGGDEAETETVAGDWRGLWVGTGLEVAVDRNRFI